MFSYFCEMPFFVSGGTACSEVGFVLQYHLTRTPNLLKKPKFPLISLPNGVFALPNLRLGVEIALCKAEEDNTNQQHLPHLAQRKGAPGQACVVSSRQDEAPAQGFI